jgi:hypothetical protein
MYQPSMRLLNTITLGLITSFETSQPHLYQTGLTVRVVIPRYFGQEQLNGYVAPITVTSPTTFTMDLNSSTFNPAEAPPNPYMYNSFPHVVPVGEVNSQLSQATHNTLG